MAKSQEYPDTIVSAGMRIDGEIKSSGNIQIDGIVSGKIHTAQDLSVGPSAQIDADIIVQNAEIAGVVRGNILAKGAVQILETGKVIGNIACAHLGIVPGAYFSGACKMQEPKTNVAPSQG